MLFACLVWTLSVKDSLPPLPDPLGIEIEIAAPAFVAPPRESTIVVGAAGNPTALAWSGAYAIGRATLCPVFEGSIGRDWAAFRRADAALALLGELGQSSLRARASGRAVERDQQSYAGAGLALFSAVPAGRFLLQGAVDAAASRFADMPFLWLAGDLTVSRALGPHALLGRLRARFQDNYPEPDGDAVLGTSLAVAGRGRVRLLAGWDIAAQKPSVAARAAAVLVSGLGAGGRPAPLTLALDGGWQEPQVLRVDTLYQDPGALALNRDLRRPELPWHAGARLDWRGSAVSFEHSVHRAGVVWDTRLDDSTLVPVNRSFSSNRARLDVNLAVRRSTLRAGLEINATQPVLPLVPAWQAGGELCLAVGVLEAGTGLRVSGPRLRVPGVIIEDESWVGVRLRGVVLRGRVSNLLDRHYELVPFHPDTGRRASCELRLALAP